MNAQENTREGGTERTAAAGSASRAFAIGDRVAYTCGHFDGAGVVDKLLPNDVIAVRRDCGAFAYPLASECTPIEDAPAAVVDAVFAESPVVMDDEPIDLGHVDLGDAHTAMSLDAVALLVRICHDDGLTIRERVTIDGLTWLVDVRPE